MWLPCGHKSNHKVTTSSRQPMGVTELSAAPINIVTELSAAPININSKNPSDGIIIEAG